ncbi:MAG: hypothetical protein M1834_004885 [Cirrosporium novae-zelandiae]|nr:MAG: hypothetical protein M1834_004885 [Cirrosporium novae-zelandiae]
MKSDADLLPQSSTSRSRPKLLVREDDITILHNPPAGKALADVVFVHGLQGHPRKTWQCSTASSKPRTFQLRLTNRSHADDEELSDSVYWPADLLPEDYPNFRILSYGYDSHVSRNFKGPANKSNLSQLGEDMLNRLVGERSRSGAAGRPIIFVAHSLGGLLVKEAVVESKKQVHDESKRDIYNSTRAAIFFGTPHRGSEDAKWGLMIQRIAKVAFDTNEKILGILRPDSEILDKLARDFQDILEDGKIKICNFLESSGKTQRPPFNGKVVPDFSASFGSRQFEYRGYIKNNHMNMCRFNGKEDGGYARFLDGMDFCTKALETVPTAEDTSKDSISSGGGQYEAPHKRNARFCGRDKVLSTLHGLLVKDIAPRRSSITTGQLRSCVIHGMGGVGKTQVAIEYTYRYRDSYDFIFWIHAENEAVLASSITKISSSLGLKLAENAISTGSVVECVRKWLEETNKRWLLVFDNVETRSILEPCLPRTNDGAFLITSQDDQLSLLAADDIHLEPLDSTEGSKLILKLLPKTGAPYEIEDAKRISTQLGGLPLALGYVAGYISKTKWSLQEFLNFFKDPQVSASIFAMPPPTTINQYEKTLAMVWELSLQKLDLDQIRVIQILSMLGPDGTPEDILYANHQEPELVFLSSSKIKAHNFGIMIGDLASRHLVSREKIPQNPQLFIHRSLQKNVLHDLEKDASLLQHTFDLACILIRKVYPKQSPTHDPQNEHWKTQELYQPHILNLHSVYKTFVQQLIAPIDFAELLSDAVYYFWERGALTEGSELTDTAEDICDKYPQASYVTRANVYSLGAVQRWSRGITTRALILRRFLKALALLQKHVNELNLDEATPQVLILYATSWNDVAHIFMEHEFYEDAIRCLDLCIAIKRCLGDDLGVLGANRNKALALVWLNRFREALTLVPDDDKVLLELLTPRCASYYERCRFGWANILIMTEDLKRAEDLLQKNLHSRKLLCGETGHYTLDSYYLLGITHRKMGNTQEAMYSNTFSHASIANYPIRHNFKKALEDSADWSEEAKSLAKHHLSKALDDIGQHDEAQNLSKEADAVRRKLWGPYATYINVPGGDDDETYDHLASSEMGRITIGKFQASGKLPKLMKICQDIQERLNALGEGQILPSTCCKMCKSSEIDISEAEIYGVGRGNRD